MTTPYTAADFARVAERIRGWRISEPGLPIILAALDAGGAALDERATQAAQWIICAVNTLSGFRAEIPK